MKPAPFLSLHAFQTAFWENFDKIVVSIKDGSMTKNHSHLGPHKDEKGDWKEDRLLGICQQSCNILRKQL